MVKFSLIVLAKTDSESIYEMNLNCFNTFIKSTAKSALDYEIILIETSKDNNWEYTFNNFKLIVPAESFNFHKFLNIGIAEAIGDFYVLSNNDVVFDENWLVETLNVFEANGKILSFSPYDSKSNRLAKSIIEKNNYVIGYEIQKHLTGWCIVTNKRVFEIIKKLDERFDFYYADFDYAMQLQKYNINHALVTNAKVEHLHSKSSSANTKTKNSQKLRAKLPNYIINENWNWVLENDKMVEGILKYHDKWGSRRLIKIKLFISNQLKRVNLGHFSKFVITNK